MGAGREEEMKGYRKQSGYVMLWFSTTAASQRQSFPYFLCQLFELCHKALELELSPSEAKIKGQVGASPRAVWSQVGHTEPTLELA